MKKLLSIFILTASVITASGQKQAILTAFNKYGIDPAILEPKTKEQPDNYAFDLKYSTIAANKETITLAKFDPSKAEAERWTVVSVKGKAPSASEIKSFKKSHSKQPVNARVDESTYLIEKESPEYLVISFMQDPTSLPKEGQFMKDCRLHLTINLKTKRMEKLESLNEKPLKIKIFNAEKLDLVIKYNWDEKARRYFIESEDMNLIVKFLGQLAPMETLSEYSNYKKVL